ncbi:MAG: peptidylprolyl isomerase [Sumerlaeia bacterium]
MMQAMRDPKLLKWGLYAILAIAIPSFVMLGPSFNSSNSANQQIEFVEVETQDGSKALRNNDLRNAQNRATFENANIFGLLSNNQSFQFEAYQALPTYYNNNRMELAEYAVGSEAIREMARRYGLAVTPKLISDSLSQQFPSQEELDQFLADSGISQNQLVSETSQSLLLDLGQRQVVNIARASILESWLAYKNTNDLLEASFVKIPVVALQQEIEVSEEEIQSFFQENAEDYVEQEKRVYKFVSVPTPPLPGPITVSPSEIQAYYDSAEKVGNPVYAAPIGKKIRHITLNINDANTTDSVTTQMEEIRQLIIDGADFAQTANDFSQDPANLKFGATLTFNGGQVAGNLNDLSAGELAERYGETWVEAVSELEVGQLSGIIMGQNISGENFLAIAEVTGLSDGILTVEGATPIIEALLRQEKIAASDKEKELRDEAVNALEAMIKRIAAESTTLESIAAKLDVSVGVTSPTLTTATFIREIGNLTEYREYLGELEMNIPSQVLRAASPDNFVILEVAEELPSRPQTLEEVRLVIESLVKRQKATAKAEEIANEIAAAARTTEDGLDSALEKFPEYKETYTIEDTVEPFSRNSPPPQLRNFQSLAFSTFSAKEGDVLVLRAGSAAAASEFVVLQLTNIDEPSKEKFLAEFGNLEQNLTGLKQITFVQEFRKDAPSMLKPEYNRELLEPEVRERSSRRGRRSRSAAN